MTVRPCPALFPAAAALGGSQRFALPPPLPPPRGPEPRRRALLLALLVVALLLAGLPAPAGHAAGVAAGVAARAAASSGAAWAAAGASGDAPGAGRAWPVGGPGGVRGRFEAPPKPWAAGHRGVDLAAPSGTDVRSAAPGVVTYAGLVAGRPVVTVTHQGSGTPPLRTTYLPVAGSVPVGTAVSAGQVVGQLAPGTGHCADDCLHWGLLRGERYLDPLALLGAGAARLLPLGGSG
ncbi:M23 family metallopeptidase [Kitasatospora sp. NPDC048239]|uniref:M23 family metallopeptidase n=1 Tax=Kitasatospora sp. NPDC048239 TaxID=3364046 RepID=UPI00372062DF